MALEFEWDPRKAGANRRRHKVSFEEAATVFADPMSLTIPDPDHSDEEKRFVILGVSLRNRLLVVVHTERRNRIRLISARKATPAERHQYDG